MRYIEAEELHREYKKSVEQGKCTERLGVLFIQLTDHLLQSANFRRYPNEMKEDMKSYALYKLVRSVDTVNLDMTPVQVFNYCTRAAWLAYLTEISKYYKTLNLQRDLERQYLEQADFLDPVKKQERIAQIDEIEKGVQAAREKNKKAKMLRKRQ